MDRIYTLPEGWSYKELKEIADVITGVSFKPDDIIKEGIRILRSGNIQNGYVLTKKDDVFLKDTYYNKQNTIQYLDNCITSSTGSIDVLGKCGTIFDVFEKTQIGAFLRLVRSRDVDNALYISLILHSPLYFQYIRQFAKNGTSINNIKSEHLEDFRFPLPPKDIKERISRFYLSLEKKILLNTHINAELEAMAKQLYDYWFVQFDFPNENGKPYKSSGGKMVYNEKLKREIPEGWGVSTYGSEFDVKLGGTPSTSEKSFWINGTINWLNSGEVQNFPINKSEKKITEEAIRGSSTEFLPKGSVLISITRYLRVTLLNIDACINQSVAGFAETEIYKYPYTYFALSAEVPRLMKLRTGAQQPHINKEIIEESAFLIPPKDLLSEYYRKSIPIFKTLINLSEETEELTHLRDSLLPMLMNGQVTVE